MSHSPLLTVRIHVVSPTGTRMPPVELNLDPASTLRDLLARLIRDQSLAPGAGWAFRGRDGTPLQPQDTLRQVVDRPGGAGGVLELILVPSPAPGMAAGAPAAPPAPAAKPSARPAARSAAPADEDLDIAEE